MMLTAVLVPFGFELNVRCMVCLFLFGFVGVFVFVLFVCCCLFGFVLLILVLLFVCLFVCFFVVGWGYFLLLLLLFFCFFCFFCGVCLLL